MIPYPAFQAVLLLLFLVLAFLFLRPCRRLVEARGLPAATALVMLVPGVNLVFIYWLAWSGRPWRTPSGPADTAREIDPLAADRSRLPGRRETLHQLISSLGFLLTLRLSGKRLVPPVRQPGGWPEELLSGCALPVDEVSASAARLCDILGVSVAELQARWGRLLTDDAALPKLLELARDDYRSGRVLMPAGWLLSRTETELLAMLWHTRTR